MRPKEMAFRDNGYKEIEMRMTKTQIKDETLHTSDDKGSRHRNN